MIARIAAVLLLAGVAAASAANSDFTREPKPPAPFVPIMPTGVDCAMKHPSRDVISLKQLPAPIRAALKKVAGAMADRGEFFNSSDVMQKPGPFNRFIRGGESGGRWYVWYEHGGFAYWHQVVVFEADGSRVVSNVHSNDANLCAMTDLLIYGNQAP
jgi:hypothetical protein